MFEELITYNHVANFEVIDAFSSIDEKIPEATRLFSHILNAQIIWTSRINNEPVPFDTFFIHPVSNFSRLQSEATEGLKRLLVGIDLATPVTYGNSAGEKFTNVLSDILYHIVNHSTYHRAQVATLFRQNGRKPPVTDFIILKREGKL